MHAQRVSQRIGLAIAAAALRGDRRAAHLGLESARDAAAHAGRQPQAALGRQGCPVPRAAGRLLRALGGIPVDRRARSNFVDQMVEAFSANDSLMIAILPEGTRRNATHWKTGFYYIALDAGVPIVMGYADYRSKVVGLGPALIPTGDIQADFEPIQAFYAGITGKHPERQGAIQIR